MDADTNDDGQAAHPEALADVVAEARTLVSTLRVVDAPGDALARAATLVREAHELLAPHHVSGMRAQSGLRFEKRGEHLLDVADLAGFFPYSPVIGRLNALAPPVELRYDGARVHGNTTLSAAYTGPPASVHGGVIALVFDELLGGVCVCNGLAAFTGTLSVRYEQLTPIEDEIELEGWVERTEGRKVFVVGEMRAQGRLTARAEGIFIRAAM